MEEKEYYTLEEIAILLDRKRATIYNRMSLIGMKGHKFKGDRKTYLSYAETMHLKMVFEKPWTAPEKDESPATLSLKTATCRQ